MNLRKAIIENLICRRRDSSEMLPVPSGNKEVRGYLQNKYPKGLVCVVGWCKDRARIEHNYWCLAGDWHVDKYEFWVDDDDAIVYCVTFIGGW